MLEHEDLDAKYTGKSTRVNMAVKPAEVVKNRKAARMAAQGGSAVSAGRKSEAGRKLAQREAKKKAAKIKRFSNTVLEIAPLIDIASKGTNSKEEFESALVGYFRAQKSIKSSVIEALMIDEIEPHSRHVAFSLGRRVAELIAKGSLNNLANEKVEQIIDIMNECNTTSPVLMEMMTEQIVSSDVLVNIKCTIFPYALRQERILSEMGASDLVKNTQLRAFHTMAIYLTKDVAFNWDKDSGFREREILFENMLEHCCEIAFEAWKSSLMQNMENDYFVLDESLIFEKLTSFQALLQERDMGYTKHPKFNMSWLEEKVSKFLFDYLNDKSLTDLSDRENGIYLSNLLKEADEVIADAWIEMSDGIIAQVKAMNKEDQKKWAATVGSKPMSISNVFDMVTKKLDNKPSMLESIEFDVSEMERDAKTRLAMLWGLSNAICKIKKRS